MSFYVYYGKLDTELLVVVLPNGTVEHGDPIHLYTKKKFSSYTAEKVTVNDDAEDVVAFKDSSSTYEAVSKKAYKELALTVKSGNARASRVTLTREYDQPFTAIPLSDPPRIWTGVLNYGKWAENESFFIIAPKGLGNDKPVVAIWQWTVDNKGTPDTLTWGTSKQKSNVSTPSTFSFVHNGFYTLNCKMNSATEGLNVTVKSPTNSDVVLKELALSAKIEIGAEHKFAPPRSLQEKITLDCSLPQATSSLPRITGALPFPADLLDTLAYSAAYVDQAGYLAKYAVQQFDQLDRSFHQLENKAELRATKIVALQGDVRNLSEANTALESKNAQLKKQIKDNEAAAEKIRIRLQDELNKALKDLHAAEQRNDDLEKDLKKSRAYIAADKIADYEREQKFIKHDAEDHKAIKRLTQLHNDATKLAERLQKEVNEKNEQIAGLKATIENLRKDLLNKDANITELNNKITKLEKRIKELEKDLTNEKALHDISKSNFQVAGKKLADAEGDVKRLDNEKALLDKKLADARKDRDEARRDRDDYEKQLDAKQKELDQVRIEAKAKLDESRADFQKFKDNDQLSHTEPVNTVDIAVPKTNVTSTVTEIVH